MHRTPNSVLRRLIQRAHRMLNKTAKTLFNVRCARWM